MESSSPALEFSVETVSDYGSFLELELVWNKLVEDAGIDHPFVSHEWIRTWWECFGAGKELHILVVKAGKEAIAIAPLALSHGRMYGLKVRRLESIYNAHMPRFDFIVARWQKEAYHAIWNYLLKERARWDVLEVRELPAGSSTLEELPRLAAGSGFLMGLSRSAYSPYLPLVGTWDNYLNSLASKHRSNLRSRLRRLSRLGQIELEVISSGRQVESALEEGLRIEAAAWKGEAGTAIRSRPELGLFYTRLGERAAQRGWLRLHFLTVNGCKIAFGYSLCYKNKLYLLKDGYDPQYSSYSPFNLLCYMVLRDAFERGLAEFDFLGANEEWKLNWTSETRPHYWHFVLPNHLRTRLLHWGKFQLVPSLKRHRLGMALRDAVLGLRKRFRSE